MEPLICCVVKFTPKDAELMLPTAPAPLVGFVPPMCENVAEPVRAATAECGVKAPNIQWMPVPGLSVPSSALLNVAPESQRPHLTSPTLASPPRSATPAPLRLML